MSAPLTWSLRSAHALLPTAARLSFRPSKLHLVVESTSGYVIGGLISFLSLPAIFALRKMGQPAVVIVGDSGKQSACAAQGLPSVTGIHATAPATAEVS